MCVQGVQQGRYRRRHDGYRRVVDVVKTEFNIRLSRTALKPRDGVGTTVRGNRRVRAAAALGNNSQTPVESRQNTASLIPGRSQNKYLQA